MNVNDIVEIEEKTITDAKFEKLMVEFLLDEPFFASIVMHLKKVKTKSIPTAGVTAKDNSLVLYWNPKFVSSLNFPTNVFSNGSATPSVKLSPINAIS